MQRRRLCIDEDMLGLVSFLVMGGNGMSVYGAGLWWLSAVCEQLNPKDITGHIIALAFDNIPGWAAEAYCKFAVGQVSLTRETERFLRARGFLYGKVPTVPRLMLRECKWRMNYIYEADWSTPEEQK